MSDAASGVPAPREVWRAALEDRRITVTVQRHDGSVVEVSGPITERRKRGDCGHCHVTIQFVPDGELAPIELEAAKERGEWTTFRAFHWTQPAYAKGPSEHCFQFIGRVTALDIPEGRWNRDVERVNGVTA